MKKVLFGFVVGAGVAAFGILFSGCNHHDRDRAEIFYVTTDEDIDADAEAEVPWCDDSGACDENSQRDHCSLRVMGSSRKRGCRKKGNGNGSDKEESDESDD